MTTQLTSRRKFMANVGAASMLAGTAGASTGLAADGKEKLAIEGGPAGP